MIECIFTLDYEVYGNGVGALKELVYEPTEQLKRLFDKWNAKFVNFVEVSEFERIEEAGTDRAIDLVRSQVRELGSQGFEIALHLHPQWYNARFENGQWNLDYSEYNLCTLSKLRIKEIVSRAVVYMRTLVDNSRYVPLSFRAGNWLFQPTQNAATVLSEVGIRIDSSVFKGGLQHNHSLDYRPARKNGYYWHFESDVNQPEPTGSWLELPIYTDMVPPWRMSTRKRMNMANSFSTFRGSLCQKVNRARDFMRLLYPLKFDFCRMTLDELISMMERVIQADRERPQTLKPIVAIGHSKDFRDPKTVDLFLGFLDSQRIPVSTFRSIYPKLQIAKVGEELV